MTTFASLDKAPFLEQQLLDLAVWEYGRRSREVLCPSGNHYATKLRGKPCKHCGAQV